MFGGGAVTFEIEPKRGTVNDINKRLMDFYRVVRDHPKKLVEQNKKHKHSSEYYYKARDRFNIHARGGHLDQVEQASLMLYLNRTCFNGLFRENRKGEFNVPFGRYKNPDFVMEESILSASRLLKRLEILDGDFDYILDKAKAGDLVYVDPPYQPISKTSSFTAYSKEAFGLAEQTRLRDILVELDKNGVDFVLSNSSAREISALYEGVGSFRMKTVMARRAINCNGTKRGEVGEIIVTNVPRGA
jgi:DNA adenine methylase